MNIRTTTIKGSESLSLLLALLVLFGFTEASSAAPALDSCINASGTRICRDNEKKNLWYLYPPKLTIARRKNNIPDYHLSLYRYFGRKGTGDEGRFYLKGMLTVTVERNHPEDTLKNIKKLLRRRGIFYPRFRSIPVSSSTVRLVFGDAVMETKSGTRWSGNTLNLPLDREMAMLLGNATDKGTAHIILMIDEIIKGVRESDGAWEEAEEPHSQSLEIDLDAHRFPSNFSRPILDQKMDVAYTSIEVWTYDIENRVVPGLYAEDVEIAVKVPGGQEVKRLHFTRNTGHVQTIKFSRAADRNIPYRVRVTCIYQDGRVVQGPWIEKRGEAELNIYKCEPKNIDAFKIDAEEIP